MGEPTRTEGFPEMARSLHTLAAGLAVAAFAATLSGATDQEKTPVTNEGELREAYDEVPADEHADKDGRTHKLYEYGDGHKFKVFKPESGRMAMEMVGGGTGTVSVDAHGGSTYQNPGVTTYPADSEFDIPTVTRHVRLPEKG